MHLAVTPEARCGERAALVSMSESQPHHILQHNTSLSLQSGNTRGCAHPSAPTEFSRNMLVTKAALASKSVPEQRPSLCDNVEGSCWVCSDFQQEIGSREILAPNCFLTLESQE